MTYLGPARQSDRSRGIGIGALPALVIASALSLVVAACGSSTSTINGNDASVNGKGGTTGAPEPAARRAAPRETPAPEPAARRPRVRRRGPGLLRFQHL